MDVTIPPNTTATIVVPGKNGGTHEVGSGHYQFTAEEPESKIIRKLQADGGLTRLDAQDAGVVMKHGDGPNRCDYLGARDVWVWESGGTYYMHYDGAGPKGWLACLATSKDLINWTKFGPVLQLGKPGEDDSAYVLSWDTQCLVRASSDSSASLPDLESHQRFSTRTVAQTA
jgi:hypothetical protein